MPLSIHVERESLGDAKVEDIIALEKNVSIEIPPLNFSAEILQSIPQFFCNLQSTPYSNTSEKCQLNILVSQKIEY